jgi:hypothetical protein
MARQRTCVLFSSYTLHRGFLHAACLLMLISVSGAQVPSAQGTEYLHTTKEDSRKSVFSADVFGERHHHRNEPTPRTTDDLNDMHTRLNAALDESMRTQDDAGAWEKDVASMQQRVVDMFYHAYDNYMLHAFPHDELLPLSCHYVDNFGSYALTLVDSLDMLAVLGNRTEFTRAVGLLQQHLTFDVDACISVFETNIRVMGGLLSGMQQYTQECYVICSKYHIYALKNTV